MEYRPLGRTGVRVSQLCLGAMLFGSSLRSPDGSTTTNPEGMKNGIRTIHEALDAGINIIDTADAYSKGESEEIVGAAIKGRRDDVLVATKGHVAMGDQPNMRGNSRHWLLRACEASLRRLDTDYIDLYQLHRPDPACDIDETLSVLTDLIHAGKVRYAGGSGFSGSAIVEAQWTADRRGRERIVSEQSPYSILVRGIENDVLPTCQRHGMGVLSYGPLAHGWLTGSVQAAVVDPNSQRTSRIRGRDAEKPRNASKVAAVEALARLADEIGVPLAQLAVAWAMNHPAVSSVIVGVRNCDQLGGLLGAVDIDLSAEVLDRIDEIVLPGVTLNPDDSGEIWLYGTPTRPDPKIRRR